MTKKAPNTIVPATTVTTVVVKTALHESMKRIRQARRIRECADVSLSRIYNEALDKYIHAKEQQTLLDEWGNAEDESGGTQECLTKN